MNEGVFSEALGISYPGTLPKIKKSNDPLRPLYEGFTNSLEALEPLSEGKVTIELRLRSSTVSDEYNFDSFVIKDTGVGFNDSEFTRLENLNDDTKGILNKGSGRIQLVHFFSRSEYISVFKDGSSVTGFKERKFVLSKSPEFLKHNAIVYCEFLKECENSNIGTTLTLGDPLEKKDEDFYRSLNVTSLKNYLIAHYLSYFCEHRDGLPQICIEEFLDDKSRRRLLIESEDIPKVDKSETFSVKFSSILPDGKVCKIDRKESFTLKAFKVADKDLPKNGLKLVSKREIAGEIRLEGLLDDDHIDNMRYLFLLSSVYIDEKDTDTRGRLEIPTLDDFKKRSSQVRLFEEKDVILLDDIQEEANDRIVNMYSEIKEKSQQKIDEVFRLKEMFLLDQKTIEDVKIKISDTESKILEKVYQADAKNIAKRDALIKQKIDAIDHMDTSSEEYSGLLEKEVSELMKDIPLQNRNSLARYVARRRLVLGLFDKILQRQLKIQVADGRSIDEKLLHNLIFQQSSNKPNESDLWLINEEYIYFKGSSDRQLGTILINGVSLLKDDFNEDEAKYVKKLGENKLAKEPDVLLFPQEGKCIIIEFKNPDVNVSKHLTQIVNYASLINNLSREQFNFTTFYGYLIGEKIDSMDVQGHDASYRSSPCFDYLFKPFSPVAGFFGRREASIYSEVITYSSLLQRAKIRNQIFIDKLMKSEGDIKGFGTNLAQAPSVGSLTPSNI